VAPPARHAGRHWAGATAAFAAEVASLAALAWWGATAPLPLGWRIALAAGLPLAAALLWGLFAAPRAPRRGRWATAGTVVLVEGGAVVALAVSGQLVLAAVLTAAVVAGRLLTGRPAAGTAPPAR
jgi:hypothetical protein